MTTHFAKAERASDAELAWEISLVNKNPIVRGLLNSISGMIAVLDEHRQVIALNDTFLQSLGIYDPGEHLGLRPGEILQCVHAYEAPSGCGTTKFCSTCGAAVAIVASLGQNRPVDRICALSAQKGESTVDIALLVRAHPIKIEEGKFLLLFLQDITLQQQRSALERMFFHDINNMMCGLVGASELLVKKHEDSNLIKAVHRLSLRLSKEMAIQRLLFQGDVADYQPAMFETTTDQVLKELQDIVTRHPSALNKKVAFPESLPDTTFNTDISLVLRVLCNIVTNALESSDTGDTVKISVEQDDHFLVFCVWNKQAIAEDVSYRIFQRNFSTKDGDGRGIGTYSMKLLGEKILNGKVSFTSTEQEGTTFRFYLPR
jgi:signal transduction histidine kinase